MTVAQIYSRTLANASRLGSIIGCDNVTDSLADIIPDADFYLVSVKDDAIAEVAAKTPRGGIWAHTSGSVPMSVFAGFKENYGVFYPLQTFSRDHDVEVGRVPVFVEGNSTLTTEKLFALAQLITTAVREADSTLRKKLHVAAVFACNFVNLMWIEADELLQLEGLTIEFLKPLLEETLRKLDSMSPAGAQTGPARRGDTKIIQEHLQMLSGEKRELYSRLSDVLLKRYANE